MINFVSIIIIVFGVLQIILFFKIWGMTNDIRAIKNKYLSETKEQKINISHHIAVGDHVIERKTGRKMIVNAINNDSTYKCDSETGVCLGNFHEHDLSY